MSLELNTAALQELLEIAQNLPENSASVSEEIAVYTEKIAQQDEIIEQLVDAVATKASPVVNLQEKIANPSAQSQEVVADEGYDGLSKVIVNPVENLSPENIKSGVTVGGVTGTLSVPTVEELVLNFTFNNAGCANLDDKYYAVSQYSTSGISWVSKDYMFNWQIYKVTVNGSTITDWGATQRTSDYAFNVRFRVSSSTFTGTAALHLRRVID